VSAKISDDMNCDLREKIKKIGDEFTETASAYIIDSMKSRPSWALYYCDLASQYQDAATLCHKYCNKTLNLLEFVCEIKKLGFSYCLEDIISLIQDPRVLNKIKQ
jgi:hypothetical protein